MVNSWPASSSCVYLFNLRAVRDNVLIKIWYPVTVISVDAFTAHDDRVRQAEHVVSDGYVHLMRRNCFRWLPDNKYCAVSRCHYSNLIIRFLWSISSEHKVKRFITDARVSDNVITTFAPRSFTTCLQFDEHSPILSSPKLEYLRWYLDKKDSNVKNDFLTKNYTRCFMELKQVAPKKSILI